MDEAQEAAFGVVDIRRHPRRVGLRQSPPFSFSDGLTVIQQWAQTNELLVDAAPLSGANNILPLHKFVQVTELPGNSPEMTH